MEKFAFKVGKNHLKKSLTKLNLFQNLVTPFQNTLYLCFMSQHDGERMSKRKVKYKNMEIKSDFVM